MIPDRLQLQTKRIGRDTSRPDAHVVFASASDNFAVLLENPKGEGRHLLLSAEGESIRLGFDELEEAESFFSRWRDELGTPVDHPDAAHAVRCAVYAAYEAGRLIEALPAAKLAPEGPMMWVHMPAWGITFLPDGDVVLFSWDGAENLELAERLLSKAIAPLNSKPVRAANISVTNGDYYKTAVSRAKAYITAGDVFQANIARYWQVPLGKELVYDLYATLRRVNAAPFAAFVAINGEKPFHILSASPERLFQMHCDGTVETRPIAGTRRRGENEQDDALKDELLLSAKERAEHIMLVDLERNDLGRVCVPGSVHVDELMAIERYATVQHIVSNVRGRLREGMDFIDVFRAMFPGGTITGCPKVHCMEIIHELEERGRGPYTGGIGYIAADHSADMNILIRTFWHEGHTLHWAAGAGIVADSDPEHELTETEHKAAGLLKAFT